jgi:hypothetical protein
LTFPSFILILNITTRESIVMQEIKLTTEQAKALETFIEDHMIGCSMYLYDEEDVREGFEPYGLYDGCETCDSRENLMATFDWLRSNNLVDIFVE